MTAATPPPTSDAATAHPAGQPPPARRRGGGNWRSLILSMLAVTAVVAVWIAIVPRPTGVEQPPVDVDAVARQVSEDADLTVWRPVLGENWKATSARFARSPEGLMTWFAGYHRTDDDRVFVSVQQTPTHAEPTASASWLASATSHGTQEGTMDVDGRTWRTFTTGGDPTRRALVTEIDDLTTVVGGLASYDQIRDVILTLRPYGS